MSSEMLGARHYDEIVGRVVEFVSIFMMNDFPGTETTLKKRFNDSPMFAHALTGDTAAEVANGVHAASASPPSDSHERVAVRHERAVVISAKTTAARDTLAFINAAFLGLKIGVAH